MPAAATHASTRWELAISLGPPRPFRPPPAAAAWSTGNLDRLDPGTYAVGQAIATHVQVPLGTTQLEPTGTQNDFIWVDYIRPNPPPGVSVPTIMDASPYFNTLGRGYLSML